MKTLALTLFLCAPMFAHAQGSAPPYCYYTHNWFHCGHVDERRPREKPVIETETVAVQGLLSTVAPKPFAWPVDEVATETVTAAKPDFVQERVLRAGGRVAGALRVSLAWHNYDDLDLHVVEPSGYEIYYAQRQSAAGGRLDVDMNVPDLQEWESMPPEMIRFAPHRPTRSPVENIIYPRIHAIGDYKVSVHNFHKRENASPGFIVEVAVDDKIYSFTYEGSPENCGAIPVATVHYDGTEFTVLKSTDPPKNPGCAINWVSESGIITYFSGGTGWQEVSPTR